MARSGSPYGDSYSGPIVLSSNYFGLLCALTALLYVLHHKLSYALAMRATDGKTKPSFEFLDSYRERLLAIRAGNLHTVIRFLVHTRAKI